MKNIKIAIGMIIATVCIPAPCMPFTLFSNKSNPWQNIQAKIKDTVVQVFVETAAFNWTEPFKSPDQDRAYGSAFFIDAEGHLVSNFHVVEDASRVMIQIPSFGKHQFECSVVGVSPERDVSLLRISNEDKTFIAKKLGSIPYLEFGDSDTIKRAEEVMALGYPLGQEKLKNTQGIVSGRENIDGESFIQITAALNPGNSGGPSIDMNGKVIGINTARISSAQNIGYILPINDLKSVIQDLFKIKLLRKPSLGCATNYANKHMIAYLKNPAPGGIYISRVYKKTLLDKASVCGGDMIYSINGSPVDMYGEIDVAWSEDKVPVSSLMNRLTIGQKITLEGYRKGIPFNKTFAFDLLPNRPIRTMYPGLEKIDYEIFGGLVFMNLALNHIDHFEDKNHHLDKYNRYEHQLASRVIITHIFGGSAAHEARVLRPGELVSEINGHKVKTLDDLRRCVGSNNEFFTVKTNTHRFMVLSIKEIIAQEDGLAARFFYKKSSLYDVFTEQPNKSKSISNAKT